MLCVLLAATLNLRGFVIARGTDADGPRSWLQHRYGRLEDGGFAVGQLGADWKPSKYFLIHADGVARAEPSSFGGRRGGLVSAFAQANIDRWQLRAGQFFLPTSRENTGDLWSSPYTINFSAWNTWIGEEFRPIGVDLQWRYTTSTLNGITFGATAFRGNDTMGTLLAWRGWTIGNRLTVYNEAVPLPKLWSLPIFLPKQRRDATTAFGGDRDGRTGYAARARFTYGDRGLVQYTHVDNNGNNLLYGNEYAWQTRFDLVSAEVGNPETTILAGEFASGRTSMGVINAVQPHRYANVGFSSGYVLVSHKVDRNRFSARFDMFRTKDRDHSPGETNNENGLAWTLTYFRDLAPRIRAGLEFTQITGDRPAAAESGFSASTDSRSVTAEVRYNF